MSTNINIMLHRGVVAVVGCGSSFVVVALLVIDVVAVVVVVVICLGSGFA